MLGSVRSRTTVAVMVVFALAALLAASAVLVVLRRSLIAEIDRSNENRLNDLLVQIESSGVLTDPGFGVDNDTFGAVIALSSGEVLGTSDESADGEVLLDSIPEDDVAFDADLGHLELTEGVTNMRATFGFPFIDEADHDLFGQLDEVLAADDALVYISSSLDGVDRTVASVRGVALVAVPALTLLVGALTWLVTKRSLRPVDQMRAEVDEITSSNLDRRLAQPPGRDAVARLGTTMNHMLERLSDGQRRQQQFVADASHELRSPLASMAAQIDVDLAHPNLADWPATANSLRSETHRMQRMVEDLLLLARSDSARPMACTDLVDLDDLVLALAGTDIDTSAVSAGLVRGDRDQLHRVVDNLIANARRHAVGRVAVSLDESGPWVTLCVDDDGAGIEPSQRTAVFERFVRLDEARGRDAGGSGLGLAICQEIVGSHGGDIRVEDSPEGGARLVVRLPSTLEAP